MIDIFLDHGVKLTEEQKKKFTIFLGLFKEWNSKINLSSIKEDKDIITKHFVDSALVLKHFDLSNKKILDLGTGGGFPAIPLAIMTNAKITAIDSVNKKLVAVQDMANNLGLVIKTVHGRAEDLAHENKYREQFDIVVTRAVGDWPLLLELCLPFLKVGGVFIAYQGPAILEEIKKYNKYEKYFGGQIENIIEDSLEDAKRIFIGVRKEKKCENIYPRNASKIKELLR